MRLAQTNSSKMHNLHDTVKHAADALAATTGVGAFFSAIPWPEIAGFLSAVWMLTRLYEYFREKYVNFKKNKKET